MPTNSTGTGFIWCVRNLLIILIEWVRISTVSTLSCKSCRDRALLDNVSSRFEHTIVSWFSMHSPVCLNEAHRLSSLPGNLCSCWIMSSCLDCRLHFYRASIDASFRTILLLVLDIFLLVSTHRWASHIQRGLGKSLPNLKTRRADPRTLGVVAELQCV